MLAGCAFSAKAASGLNLGGALVNAALSGETAIRN
jgi:hypothetical protein